MRMHGAMIYLQVKERLHADEVEGDFFYVVLPASP